MNETLAYFSVALVLFSLIYAGSRWAGMEDSYNWKQRLVHWLVGIPLTGLAMFLVYQYFRMMGVIETPGKIIHRGIEIGGALSAHGLEGGVIWMGLLILIKLPGFVKRTLFLGTNYIIITPDKHYSNKHVFNKTMQWLREKRDIKIERFLGDDVVDADVFLKLDSEDDEQRIKQQGGPI